MVVISRTIFGGGRSFVYGVEEVKKGVDNMGNTTLIELNHDRWDEIDKHKELFVSQILEQLRNGQNYEQSIEGGRVIAFFPRYSENKQYQAWCRFKKKWCK